VRVDLGRFFYVVLGERSWLCVVGGSLLVYAGRLRIVLDVAIGVCTWVVFGGYAPACDYSSVGPSLEGPLVRPGIL